MTLTHLGQVDRLKKEKKSKRHLFEEEIKKKVLMRSFYEVFME